MPDYNRTYLEPNVYLEDLGAWFPADTFGKIAALGNTDLLRLETLALFCSTRCPGRIILQVYDLAQRLRQGKYAVVSGFHTPMEKECLGVLLRGPAPVIVCPARGIDNMRLPKEWSGPLEEGRLLVLSPFDDKHKRVTAETAQTRNEFVAALAGKVFIAHAAPGGKTEALAKKVVEWGKPLLTLAGEENANLLAMGAIPVDEQSLASTSI